MTLRWLHKSWVYFWNSIGLLLATVIVISGVLYGVLQLPVTKNLLAEEIEKQFNTDRQAFLEVNKLSGHIPFSFALEDIQLFADSSRSRSILSVDSMQAGLDLRGWFSNQIIVPSIEVYNPRLSLDFNENLGSSFSKTRVQETQNQNTDSTESGSNIGLLFPRILVEKGSLILSNIPNQDSLFATTSELTFNDIDLETFLEFNTSQRFLDIEKLAFSINDLNIDRVNMFGQVFNDDRFLEFNAVNISTKNNAIRFSAEVDGVDFTKQDIKEQLKAAEFSITINELISYPRNLQKIIPEFPLFEEQIYSRLEAEGNIDSLTIESLYLLVGNSEVEAFGGINFGEEFELERFSTGIESSKFDSTNLKTWFDALDENQIQAIVESEFSGDIYGNKSKQSGEFEIQSPRGDIRAEFSKSDIDSARYSLFAEISRLDIGDLFSPNISTTSLNGSLSMMTSSFKPTEAIGYTELELQQGLFNAYEFDSLSFAADWNDGRIIPEYQIISEQGFIDGSGDVILSDSVTNISIDGQARQLDIKGLSNATNLSKALVDLNYNLRINGAGLNDAFGQLTIDLPKTIIEGDTLEVHQIYADFNSTINRGKRFRLTSTPLDVSIDGNFEPNDVITLLNFWADNLNTKVDEEFFFSPSNSAQTLKIDSLNAALEMNFNLKNYALLKSYLPNLPDLESNLSGTSNFNMNNESILFTGTILDSSFVYQEYIVDSVAVQFTGSFRANESLKSFSGFQLRANTANFSSEFIETGATDLSIELNDDSIFIQQRITDIAESNDFYVNSFANLSDSTLTFVIDSLSMGNENYQWKSTGTPSLTYNKSDRLEFQDFEFRNGEESLNFEGVFSNQVSDSVNYNIRNVDLARISELINGRINFSGILDAEFTTKSLTRIPSIQGSLGVDAFSIDDRVLGDVGISSLFNSDFNRFDTRITISTDSTKYPDYFTRTERRGQNIAFDGYVYAPEDGAFAMADSLFYFDLNFESIDLWVLPFIAPRVFTEMSGVASGGGAIWGNLEDFDFSVNYDIGMDDAVFFRPRFLDTYYFGIGNITLNRQDGLIFNDLFIIDPSGGSANLNGTYDLGQFDKIHEMDLTLVMDEFHFLNSSFDPDVAFFGDAYGSTTLRMTGTNLNPVLTTETPVIISDFSSIGIPLLEETEFDENNKFIRFVDSFEFSSNRAASQEGGSGQRINVEEDPFSGTFIERFTLDLQFVAQNPMEVQLIFDPITGDQIDANGIGRLGIRLEDEQLSMFGQFDINGGTYQFVSGEIFTRRFELEPGGTIIWEGEPGNARLNLNAVYQARPDINTLTRTRSDLDSETSQRVPVELVLNVGGSITAIQNNFFFRLPNNFETRQNSTLNTQIAALNRNEDEKLIQAASFLLMGDFIPSATETNDATNTLAGNFSGSGAVLNPLLSSQVISPLLSNQINSLLRSDIGSLDIDFNLNTYNNVDLGVALRLYNDRIILSREGQITGAQSNIGDIGATYRINNTLSVTAFHRQDPTFSNLSGGEDSPQAQDINGVGFEAEVSFNSWQEFFRRVTSPFRKLFGKKEDSNAIASSE